MGADSFLTFLHNAEFDRSWTSLGFDDEELFRLQKEIASDPEAGKVISGTGGLRKIRFARSGSGKSGGVRVCYAYFPGMGIILLACVFAKNAKANLTRQEKARFAELIAGIQTRFSGA